MKIDNISITSKLYNLTYYLKQNIKEWQERSKRWQQRCIEEGEDTVIERDLDGRTYGQLLKSAKKTVAEIEKELAETEEMIKYLEKYQNSTKYDCIIAL